MSQIICSISGETLYKSDLLLGFDLSDVHPIFQAKKELLLSTDIIFRFQAAKSLREKKLYFLAVLNTTGLIDFRCPANPAPFVVEASFMDAMTLAPWIDFAKFKIRDRVQFPHYIVDRDNVEMKNISIWISAIYDIRNLFLEKGRQEELKKDLLNKAADIEREFRTASALGRAFTLPLARWALEMAEVPEESFESWREILITPLEDAWTLEKRDIERILSHLQMHLPINNDQVIAVLTQCKLLIAKSTESYTPRGAQGDAIYSFVDDDEESGDEESKNTQNAQTFLTNLPPSPQRKDFPKLHLYLQAKAAWDLWKRKLEGTSGGEYGQF